VNTVAAIALAIWVALSAAGLRIWLPVRQTGRPPLLARTGPLIAVVAALAAGTAVVAVLAGLAAGAAERFIIGTFASCGWAAACAGIGLLLL
jgi:hypothetical protein